MHTILVCWHMAVLDSCIRTCGVFCPIHCSKQVSMFAFDVLKDAGCSERCSNQNPKTCQFCGGIGLCFEAGSIAAFTSIIGTWSLKVASEAFCHIKPSKCASAFDFGVLKDKAIRMQNMPNWLSNSNLCDNCSFHVSNHLCLVVDCWHLLHLFCPVHHSKDASKLSFVFSSLSWTNTCRSSDHKTACPVLSSEGLLENHAAHMHAMHSVF